MSVKNFVFEIDDLLLAKLNRPIRETIDVIDLLLETLKYLKWKPLLKTVKYSIRIVVGKMNRLFYVLENKIFSITMPLFIKVNDKEEITFYNCDNEINSKHLSCASAILQEVRSNPVNLWQWMSLLEDLGVEEEDFEVVVGLMNKLFLTEYGYVRYDDDLEHAKATIHTRYHLDINFSNPCTYKIGLDRQVDFKWLQDCLDTKAECKFIKI